jgi:hypothetical protein
MDGWMDRVVNMAFGAGIGLDGFGWGWIGRVRWMRAGETVRIGTRGDGTPVSGIGTGME